MTSKPPRAPRTPEQELSETVRVLLRWCTILTVTLVVALGLASLAVLKAGSASRRAATVERRTCQVQRRSLPAGREVVGVLTSLGALLEAPQTAAQRRQRASDTPVQAAAFESLGVHLQNFKRIIGRQPVTLSC